MNPKKIWANLGVENLERTTKFYTDLGLKHNGASNEITSFLFGEGDFVIHFFLKNVLAKNISAEMADTHRVNEIIFTLSATSKNETDNWATEIEQAGGKLITKPEEFGEGYYGFIFADPDGHRFNVFYM